MKRICFVTFLAFWVLLINGAPGISRDNDSIFQASTIDALSAGVYDGDITYKELKKQGNFGLGTFNALDGEMVALDGKFYQIKDDGEAYLVDDSMKTPFATVKFFKPDKVIYLNEAMSCESLEKEIDQSLPTENLFYSIKLEGIFKQVRVRSVPGQKKPYPLLVEALEKETVFELNDVRGTIVGFRMPDYMAGLNVPGYHFHFITDDRKAGGHVLDCDVQKAKVEIDYSSDFRLILPGSGEFLKTELGKDKRKDLYKLERKAPE
jgi:acetolactate decarboxylase